MTTPVRVPSSFFQHSRSDLVGLSRLGEISLFQISPGLYAHKVYVFIQPNNSVKGTYTCKADLLFKYRGSVTARLPAVFTNSTAAVEFCLFPNTTNPIGINSDCIALWNFVSDPSATVYMFPRKVIAAAEEIVFDMKSFACTTGGVTTWAAYVAIESANTPF